MDFDWRILVVLFPIIAAGSWALFNVAKVAIAQIQNFLNKQT
ncbi:MAG: photosystem II protein Y [Chroococcales cyanobacterium]